MNPFQGESDQLRRVQVMLRLRGRLNFQGERKFRRPRGLISAGEEEQGSAQELKQQKRIICLCLARTLSNRVWPRGRSGSRAHCTFQRCNVCGGSRARERMYSAAGSCDSQLQSSLPFTPVPYTFADTSGAVRTNGTHVRAFANSEQRGLRVAARERLLE